MADPRPAPLRYGIAIASTGVMVLVSWLLREPLDQRPFPLLLAAVAVAGWFGLGPGLVATLLSGLAAVYYFEEPSGSFAASGPGVALRLASFLFAAVLVAMLEGRLRAARAQAETARLATGQLAAIVESSNDAIVGVTLDGIVTSWNAGSQRLYGYTEAEIIGSSMKTLALPDMPTELLRVLERIGHGERFEAYEATHLRKDRRQIDVSMTISPIRDGDAIVGASIIARDVTERRGVEEARLQLAAIVASSEDAIYSKTLDGVITSWNQAAERLYGYAQAEIVGRHISLLAPPDRPAEIDQLLARLRARERIERFRTVRVRRDGRRVEGSVTISPIKNAAGRAIGASAIARDLSDQSEQSALRAALRRAAGAAAGEPDRLLALGQLLREALAIAEGDTGAIQALDPARAALVPVVSEPVGGSTGAATPRGQGAGGQAFELGEPVVLNDYPRTPGALEAAVRAGVQAALGVPLLRAGRPVGAITIASYGVGGSFSAVQAEAVALIAALAAPLVEEGLPSPRHHDPLRGYPGGYPAPPVRGGGELGRSGSEEGRV